MLAPRAPGMQPYRRLGDALGSGSKKGDAAGIPGRLLIKIAASEVASAFRPAGEEATCNVAELVEGGLLPEELRAARASFVTMSRRNGPVLRLELEKSLDPGALRTALAASNARLIDLVPSVALPSPPTPLRRPLVELDPGAMTGPRRLPCAPPTFPYLKEKSSLRRVLRDAGVLSMRRVFRTAETRGDTPGTFKVVPLKQRLEAAKAAFPGRTARAWPDVAVADNMENWFLLHVSPGSDLVRSVDGLARQAGIEALSVDTEVVRAQAVNDTDYGLQWGLRNTGAGGLADFDIGIESAWADPTPARRTVVAVLDTGFKEDLDELRARLWTNPGEAGGASGVDDDCNGYVDDLHGITTYDPWAVTYTGTPCSVHPGGASRPLNVHGTMVAGVIAARANNSRAIAGTAGVADVGLINVTIGWCSIDQAIPAGSAELAEGLLYAILNGADVANMSLSTPTLPSMLLETVDAALDAGLVLVASAGNDGRRFDVADPFGFVSYPACLRGVIAVGGAQRDGRYWPRSNYGPGLALVAPAQDIATLTYTTPGQTAAAVTCKPTAAECVHGTSFSAAFVSGAAAVVLSKYPVLTAPYMGAWLRATARDITDPLGVGANLVGEDEWTGAGMLAAGTATTALANSLDQPIAVDILVERLRSSGDTDLGLFSHHQPDAVAGRPDLGITVTVPASCPVVIPSPCLQQWRLDYGMGDAPAVWFPIPVNDPTNPTLTQNVIDVARTGGPYYRFVRVASGQNHLNTDLLVNRQVHTLRLTATNRANRSFTAYDHFVPMRGSLHLPFPGTAIVGRWGWEPLYGFVDTRPGAGYRISLLRDDGTPLWSTPSLAPDQRYASAYWPEYYRQVWREGASAFTKLFGSFDGPESRDDFTGTGFNLTAPAGVQPTSHPEGWVRFRLDVQTATGAVETDTLRVYLDNSYFAYAAGWPRDAEMSSSVYNQYGSEILVADMGGGLGRRLFVHKGDKLLCLDPSGSTIWEKPLKSPFGGWEESPRFSVADVDGDGTKEIAVAATSGTIWDSTMTNRIEHHDVHLLKADGTSYGPNWPRRFTYNAFGGRFLPGISKVHVGDVTPDPGLELVFYRSPVKYYGINASDIQPGSLEVFKNDGTPASGSWPRPFDEDVEAMAIELGDQDTDGRAEILIAPGTVLEGNGSLKPNWLPVDEIPPFSYRSGAKTVNLDGDAALEVLQHGWGETAGCDYEVSLRDDDNSTVGFANVWPLCLSAGLPAAATGPYDYPGGVVTAIDEVAGGGFPEILLCYEKLRVVDRAGQAIPAAPEIDLGGQCGGVALRDVDGDGGNEIVALVHRLREDPSPDMRRGSFLEAYELDGTRLADTDSRWPLTVQTVSVSAGQIALLDDGNDWNGSVALEDLDGDGKVEAIQLRSRRGTGVLDTRIEVLDLP